MAGIAITELARQYSVRTAVVYDIIYTFQNKRHRKFRKVGHQYYLTPEQIELIEADLIKQGGGKR